ncbi:unnamed protein product [Prunus armeniaca]|uniref:Uncharacterized protein n=1 Tax=Prunus armeniaca TaxID=36596 RepID=A0A6J5UID5_PRUAR|nr:unnamed protein product [Prunus armeniaca]
MPGKVQLTKGMPGISPVGQFHQSNKVQLPIPNFQIPVAWKIHARRACQEFHQSDKVKLPIPNFQIPVAWEIHASLTKFNSQRAGISPVTLLPILTSTSSLLQRVALSISFPVRTKGRALHIYTIPYNREPLTRLSRNGKVHGGGHGCQTWEEIPCSFTIVNVNSKYVTLSSISILKLYKARFVQPREMNHQASIPVSNSDPLRSEPQV